jgi:hypothetical protein
MTLGDAWRFLKCSSSFVEPAMFFAVVAAMNSPSLEKSHTG